VQASLTQEKHRLSELKNPRAILKLLKTTLDEWGADKAPRLAAALSYYTVFSLAPLLLVVIAIAGLAFGPDAARGRIDDQLRGLIGQEGAAFIQEMLQNVNQPATGIFATIVGIVTLLLGAIGVFNQLKDALNTAWDVQPKPGSGIKAFIMNNVLSFGMLLGVGFLLLVSLVVSAGLSALDEFTRGLLPGIEFVMQIINIVISFGIITALFALIYKFLPDAKIAWKDVWIGAAVTSLLFTVGKFAIGLYLGNSSLASTYGAAASLVVLFLWIYYSAQILLFGAEFTQVYARTYGSGIEPKENAISLTEAEKIAQGMTAANPPPPPAPPEVPSKVPVVTDIIVRPKPAVPLTKAVVPAVDYSEIEAPSTRSVIFAGIGVLVGGFAFNLLKSVLGSSRR
jgi:membrane protein